MKTTQMIENRILKNSKGASLLIALLVMIICVVVSTIMLSAASSSLSRVINRSHQEQLYVAADSAAEIIANNYKGMKFSATKEDGVWHAENNIKKFIAGNYLYESALSLCQSEAFIPSETEVDVSFSDSGESTTNDKITNYYTGDQREIKVTAKIKMNADFSIKCVVTATDSDNKNTYTCNFTVPASVQDTSGVNNSKSIKLVIWGTAQMAKGST